MAIRIRYVGGGKVVALCAARSKAQEGDIYLDDGIHHALSTKFMLDFESEGLITDPPVDRMLEVLTYRIESAKW